MRHPIVRLAIAAVTAAFALSALCLLGLVKLAGLGD